MSTDMNRRTFLKGTALGAASLSVLGLLGCSGYKDADEARTVPETRDVDIVVIGSGGAGLTAAVAAYDAGATNVVVLEKMEVVGGNTMHSSSGMNASETEAQKAAGIEDSNELFIEDTYKGGHEVGQMDLITYMCDNSNNAIEWLAANGIVLDNLAKMGGASVTRCHRPTDGSAVGLTLIPGLHDNCISRGIEVATNARVVDMLGDETGVTGVVCEATNGEQTQYNCKAVIVATGGFGANREWIAQYDPDIADFPTTNTPGSTGDGIALAQKLGAGVVDMEYIQTHPTVEQTTSTLVAEAIRGSGAILVNAEGNRFFNEEGTRDAVSQAELQQPGGFAWCVFDQAVFDRNKTCAKYQRRGLTKSSDTLEGLAAELEIDAAAFQATVDTWNAIVRGEAEDEFGRAPQSTVTPVEAANFYAIKIAPGIHHTMGGVRVNTDACVLTDADAAIPGLYAAGEVTGGLHGSNRLGGNAVCDIVVNGLNAGEHAAAFVQQA